MQRNFLTITLIASMAILSCSDGDRIRERPKDIIPTDIDPVVYQKIAAQFPEGQNITTSKPSLFEASAQKQVVLSEESNVYLAYISEGASYANSFGWYTYNVNEKPQSASDLDVHILFPHVSDRILKQGD